MTEPTAALAAFLASVQGLVARAAGDRAAGASATGDPTGGRATIGGRATSDPTAARATTGARATADRPAARATAGAPATSDPTASYAAARATALDAVARAAALRADLDAVLASLVDAAREAGATWQAVGGVLGISRQAAFQRFGHPVDPRTGEPMDTTPFAGAGELATAVFHDLAAGRWDAVTARFDDQMRAGLDEDGLAAAWAQVTGLVGAFEGLDSPLARRAGELTVVDVPLRFEAGEMLGRVSLRADRSIAGLFLLDPAAAGAETGR